MALFTIIAFSHDLTINPCGTPVRSVAGVLDFEGTEDEAIQMAIDLEDQHDEVHLYWKKDLEA